MHVSIHGLFDGDGIVGHTDTRNELIILLDKVLGKREMSHLYLQLKKMQLRFSSAQLLGHRVERCGMRPVLQWMFSFM